MVLKDKTIEKLVSKLELLCQGRLTRRGLRFLLGIDSDVLDDHIDRLTVGELIQQKATAKFGIGTKDLGVIEGTEIGDKYLQGIHKILPKFGHNVATPPACDPRLYWWYES